MARLNKAAREAKAAEVTALKASTLADVALAASAEATIHLTFQELRALSVGAVQAAVAAGNEPDTVRKSFVTGHMARTFAGRGVELTPAMLAAAAALTVRGVTRDAAQDTAYNNARANASRVFADAGLSDPTKANRAPKGGKRAGAGRKRASETAPTKVVTPLGVVQPDGRIAAPRLTKSEDVGTYIGQMAAMLTDERQASAKAATLVQREALELSAMILRCEDSTRLALVREALNA